MPSLQHRFECDLPYPAAQFGDHRIFRFGDPLGEQRCRCAAAADVPRLDPVRLSHDGAEPRNVILIQRHLSTSRFGPAITVPAQGVPDVVALQHQREAVHPGAGDLGDPGCVPDSPERKRLHPIGNSRQLPEKLLDAPGRFRMATFAGATATISVRSAGRVQMMPKEQVTAIALGTERHILSSADCRRMNPAHATVRTR